MRVNDICSRSVECIHRNVNVLEAARRMRERHVGDLVVVEDRGGHRVPVGVLTDRDIVVGILAKDSQDLEQLDVGDVLGADKLVIAAEDEDLTPVLRRMRVHGVRRVPVVDKKGDLVGILTLDDVVPALSNEIAEVAALVSRQADHEPVHRPR